MNASLRIALPPLAGLGPDSQVEHAWLDRQDTSPARGGPASPNSAARPVARPWS